MPKARLTLYFIPSPFPLDWGSPTSLARTLLKNRIVRKQRFMGHVNIRLEYGDTNILTGMVAKDLDAAPWLLIKDKIGLGIIYHSFPGRLESNEELEEEFKEYYQIGNKRMNFIQFDISEDMAKRVHEYLTTFKEKSLDNYYGLINSPLHGEGGGCSAFGASFMILTGLLTEDMKNAWSNTVKVPKKLAGEPLTNNKVSFFKLLLGKHTWADSSEDHHEIFFWDPDLMWKWAEEKRKSDEFETLTIDKIEGLKLDVSHIQAPNSPLFKVENVESKLPNLRLKSNLHFYKD